MCEQKWNLGHTSYLAPLISKISQIIGQIFAVYTIGGCLLRTLSRWTPSVAKFGLKTYLDILDRLGMTRECDRQTDGRIDGQKLSLQMPRLITLRGQKNLTAVFQQRTYM